MAYDISADPYLNPKTGILFNKVGAKTQKQLDKAEAEITYIVIATLTIGSQPEKLTFNTQLLLDTHEEIFRDIYKWAGKPRIYDISKGNSYFAHVQFIVPSLNTLMDIIQQDTLMKSGRIEDTVEALTYYYSELNAIHPFREGNGRTSRTFLRLLALKHGYDIEWARMEKDENINASIKAINGDTTALRAILTSIVVKLPG